MGHANRKLRPCPQGIMPISDSEPEHIIAILICIATLYDTPRPSTALVSLPCYEKSAWATAELELTRPQQERPAAWATAELELTRPPGTAEKTGTHAETQKREHCASPAAPLRLHRQSTLLTRLPSGFVSLEVTSSSVNVRSGFLPPRQSQDAPKIEFVLQLFHWVTLGELSVVAIPAHHRQFA